MRDRDLGGNGDILRADEFVIIRGAKLEIALRIKCNQKVLVSVHLCLEN
jgi:hypothetical protein